MTWTKFQADLGKRLAMLRRKRGISQTELCRRTRLSIRFVGGVETGHYIPSVFTLREWALDGLGHSLEVVVRGLR